MLKKIFILPISIFFVGCSNSNLNLDSKKLCCEQCLKSENIVKTLLVSPKIVTTKPVKTIPIVEPVKTTPIVEPVKTILIVEPVKTTPIVEPVKTTPIVEPVKTTPVVEPVKTTPIVEPVKTTPVVEPVKTTPVVNKPNGENTISLKPIPNLIDKKLLTKMENLSEDVISSILEMKNVNIIIHIYSKNTGSQHKIIEELISYFLVETPLLEDEIIIREHFINDDKQEIIIEYK
jgi:hypothetical protein